MAGEFDSSRLNRRITLQQRGTPNPMGPSAADWSDVVTTWAEIRPLQGRELVSAQAINAEVTHEVLIRYRANVTSSMRAVYQGRVLDIRAVLDEVTAHRFQRLLCSEGLTQG